VFNGLGRRNDQLYKGHNASGALVGNNHEAATVRTASGQSGGGHYVVQEPGPDRLTQTAQTTYVVVVNQTASTDGNNFRKL